MALQDSIQLLQTKVDKVRDLNCVLRFDCGADGSVLLDGKAVPHTVSLSNRMEADVVIHLTADMFEKIVNGSVNPGVQFVMGKIKVKGDKTPLLKLQKLL